MVLYEQKHGEDCVVSFISSVKHPRLRLTEIKVKASTSNGLKMDSVIKLDKIATLQKKIILGELGILEAASLKVVDSCLKKMFNLR